MGFGVDGFELRDADLGVDARGFELFVAEELCDGADIDSAFEHVSGAKIGILPGFFCAPLFDRIAGMTKARMDLPCKAAMAFSL